MGVATAMAADQWWLLSAPAACEGKLSLAKGTFHVTSPASDDEEP
jgi:hypothetical protein